jgi:xanthine dehydrogenase YagR molybdenum-binding subunit
MDSAASFTGFAHSRVDGVRKVTGSARYAAEFAAAGLAVGCLASSAIAKGRIVRLHTQAAAAVPGVLRIFSHEDHRRTERAAHRARGRRGL